MNKKTNTSSRTHQTSQSSSSLDQPRDKGNSFEGYSTSYGILKSRKLSIQFPRHTSKCFRCLRIRIIFEIPVLKWLHQDASARKSPCLSKRPKKNLCVRLFCITVLLKSCQTPLTMHDIHLLQNLAAILAQTASLNEDHKINAEKMWKCGLNTFKYIIYIYITVHGKTIFHSPIWWCMM